MVNFETATNSCRANGGEIALPTSNVTSTSVMSAVALKYDELVTAVWPYTSWSELQFVWINLQEDENNTAQSDLTFLNYKEGQPNYGHEKCVAFEYANFGFWSDRSCTEQYPYVCEFLSKF